MSRARARNNSLLLEFIVSALVSLGASSCLLSGEALRVFRRVIDLLR
jgi:hypothetical protein